VEQRGRRQKPQERREIANERLEANLFAHVQLDVRLERRARIVGLPHHRDAAKAQHTN
jgi:hypothetical protein